MKCDYELLSQYRSELENIFRYFLMTLHSIKDSNDIICSNDNWQSLAGDYYKDITNNLDNNEKITSEKFQNILDYLENVVTNYEMLDRNGFKFIM